MSTSSSSSSWFQDNAVVIFDIFPAFLKNKIDALKQIALKNTQQENFNNKWKNFIWSIVSFFFLLLFSFRVLFIKLYFQLYFLSLHLYLVLHIV